MPSSIRAPHDRHSSDDPLEAVMVAFLLEIAIAAGISFWLSKVWWWAPLVSFPLVMRVANFMYEPPQLPTSHRVTKDTLIMLMQIGWICAAVIICVQGLDSWWGVVVGLLAAWIGWGALTPRRWVDEVRHGV